MSSATEDRPLRAVVCATGDVGETADIASLGVLGTDDVLAAGRNILTSATPPLLFPPADDLPPDPAATRGLSSEAP